jgi:hypothetical protein
MVGEYNLTTLSDDKLINYVLPIPFNADLLAENLNGRNTSNPRKIDMIIHSLKSTPSVKENITHQYKIIEYLSLIENEDLIKIFNDENYKMYARYDKKTGFMSSILTSGFYILYLYVLERINAKVSFRNDLKIIFNALLRININIYTKKIIIPNEDFNALLHIINILQCKNTSNIFKNDWWNNIITNYKSSIKAADNSWTFWKENPEKRDIDTLNSKYKFLPIWPNHDVWENCPCYINKGVNIINNNDEYIIRFEILKNIFNGEKVNNINIRNCNERLNNSQLNKKNQNSKMLSIRINNNNNNNN